MTRLTDTELEAYAVHATATADVPLQSLVEELQEARRLLAHKAEEIVGQEGRRQRHRLRPKGTSE